MGELSEGASKVLGFRLLAADDQAFINAKELGASRANAKARAKAAARVPTGPNLNDTVTVATNLKKFFIESTSYKEKQKVGHLRPSAKNSTGEEQETTTGGGFLG